MLPEAFTKELENKLSSVAGGPVSCKKIIPVSGGSINICLNLQTNYGDFFVKYNNRTRYPGMFECEKKGLQLIADTKVIRIPKVIASGEFENWSFLLQEMVKSGKRSPVYFEELGRQLALMHRVTSLQFGLDHNNYIGSLPQDNSLTVSGYEFMIRHRFQPLVKKAYDLERLSKKELTLFELYYKALPDLLPDEPPSLIHGDLWNGNVIPGNDGAAWLIDPAVYYGYRESDLAMTRLFGGFPDDFYNSYHETFPLPKGWETRIGCFQIYPLLVHLILFGEGYLSAILHELKNFTK